MLPPFIIEQIRKREEEQHRRDEQPVVEMPLPRVRIPTEQHTEEERDRGVVVIDLFA